MAAQDDFESFRKTPAWLCVYFNNMFWGCTGFSIVLPTVWPYLREMGSSTTFLAWVIAMYSVGEGTGGWLIGQVYAKFPNHPKLLLQIGMALGSLASLFYSIAPIFGPKAAPLIVLAARFLSGCDNGGRQTIEQTFIGTYVPSESQTTISSRLSSFAITGIMLGPAFGAPLQAVHFEVPGIGLTVDGNNGPGLVLSFVCLMNIIVTSVFFDTQAIVERAASRDQLQDAAEATAPKGSRPPEAEAPPRRMGLMTCYAVFFAINLNMASLETITPVVAQRLYGWGPCLDPARCPFSLSETYVNDLMTAGGLLSLVMSVLMSVWLGRKVFGRETAAIAVGLLVYAATNLLNVDWTGSLPAWCFVAGYLIAAFFGGLMRGPNISLLSQIIGPHQKAQYMGVLFAAGAAPRVFGPFLLVDMLNGPAPIRDADFTDVYIGPVPRTWLLYGGQAVLFLGVLLLVQVTKRDLRPHPSLQKSPPAHGGALGRPLLDGSDEQAATMWQGDHLPATPTGVREGICDFAPTMMRAVSGGLHSGSPSGKTAVVAV